MIRLLAAASFVVSASTALAAPVGTTITYQGHLTDNATPAEGLYDFQLCLYDSTAGGNLVACSAEYDKVPVEAGIFTLAPDFGAASFEGEARSVEIRVRAGDASGSDVYTILAPRQRVLAAPEALHSGSAPWDGLTGVPPGFGDGIDDVGAGITSVSAGFGLTGGTISTQGTLAVNDAAIQRRVAGACASGAIASVKQDGSVTCVSTGTVTSVAAGAGLTGGIITGAGTLAIAPNAIGLAQIKQAEVQARILGSCDPGDYIRAVTASGSVMCERIAGGAPLVVPITLSATGVNVLPAMAVPPDGNPVISFYHEINQALVLAKCSDASCAGPVGIRTVEDSSDSVGKFSSIAIAADGNPIISYWNESAGRIHVAVCSAPDCSARTLRIVPDLGSFTGPASSIAVNESGTPYIAYFDDSLDALKIAVCQDPTCSAMAVHTIDDPAADEAGRSISMAIAGTLPVIAYYGASASLKLARCLDAACAASASVVVDDPANELSGGISLAFSGIGLPLILISYHDGVVGDLKLAACVGMNCQMSVLSTLDGANALVGRHSSLAIGSDGLARVAYSDTTSAMIRFGKCADQGCTSLVNTTVLTLNANNAGARVPMVIPADGLPAIAFPQPGGGLKFFKCGTSTCQ